MATRLDRTAAAWGAAALAACGPGAEEHAARAAVQAAARVADSVVAAANRDGRVFRGTLGGRRLALMVDDCAVYDLAEAAGGGRRRPVLTPDAYPWPTVCARQSIAADTAWLTVRLGRTGLGAGGCCATGGTYRTRDGRVWERERAGGRWAPAGRDPAVR